MRTSASGLWLTAVVGLGEFAGPSGQVGVERPGRPWTEQVLPYALASMRVITPSGWTLTETSRELRLGPRQGHRPHDPPGDVQHYHLLTCASAENT